MESSLKDLNKELINWINDNNDKLFQDVEDWNKDVDSLIKQFIFCVRNLFFGDKNNKYTNNPRTLIKLNKINENNAKYYFDNIDNKNLIFFNEKIKQIKSIDLLDSKDNKLVVDTPLYNLLNDILNSDTDV